MLWLLKLYSGLVRVSIIPTDALRPFVLIMLSPKYLFGLMRS